MENNNDFEQIAPFEDEISKKRKQAWKYARKRENILREKYDVTEFRKPRHFYSKNSPIEPRLKEQFDRKENPNKPPRAETAPIRDRRNKDRFKDIEEDN